MNLTVQYKDIENKIVVDGKMAFLISSAYSTRVEYYRFDPEMITLFMDGADLEAINKCLTQRSPYAQLFDDEEDHFRSSVQVKWVPVGTLFQIGLCGDKGEYVMELQKQKWFKA